MLTMKKYPMWLIVLKVVITEGYISPCPKLFTYEPSNSKADMWYGRITLTTSKDISGIFLRLKFDKKTVQLGNWFGEVSTNDYKEYTIKNKNFVLKNGTNYPVRFYIKYDVNIKPKLISIAFNNKLICPEPAENAWEDGNFPDDFALTNQSRAGLREICGTVIARPIPLITYGTTAIEGEYPWHAAVYHVKDFKMTYICGGSLITHNFIITVAHCVTKAKTVETFLPVNIVTFLGKYYLQQFSNPGMQEHPTVEIVIHPGFNPYSFANDISLIQLKRNAKFTDYVRPICLWQDSINVTEILNQNGKIVGWGYNEAGKITDQLMEITMPVVSQEMCLASFPQFYTRFTSDNTYCAGFRNGSSVCNGDSGGGMVFPKKNNDFVWQLRGLVSISIALKTQFCDTSHYVVFTDTAMYLNWIQSVIA